MTRIAALALLILSGCGKALTTSERFDGPWLAPTPLIATLLAKHHVTGCGEFYMRRAKDSESNSPENGDYLLYCTADGDNWVAWEAFPSTDAVLGPSALEPGIPLPDRSKISS